MNLLIWVLTSLGVIGLDQLTKWLTVTYLKPIGDRPLIEGWLHLTYVENTGAAFGMMKDSRWVFLIVSTVGIAAMLVSLIVKRKTLPLFPGLALSMVIGGGIGNQIDRLLIGHVTDMIYVKIIDFAVFNVADSFVCVGAGLLFLYVLFFDPEVKAEREKKKKRAEAPADGTN